MDNRIQLYYKIVDSFYPLNGVQINVDTMDIIDNRAQEERSTKIIIPSKEIEEYIRLSKVVESIAVLTHIMKY